MPVSTVTMLSNYVLTSLAREVFPPDLSKPNRRANTIMHWRVEWAATVAQNAATDLVDVALLLQVCLDCLEHRVDDSEAKLEALLKILNRDLLLTLKELPGALEVILEALEAQERAVEPRQE